MTKCQICLAATMLPLAFALSGCMSPADYETAPVEVTTSRGVVTCQLYTHDRVLWDRAIDRPETMTVKDADDICVAEGYRVAGR